MIFEKLILKIILIQNIFYIFYFQLCTSLREMGLKKFLFIVETQCRLTIFIEISKIQVFVFEISKIRVFVCVKYQKYGFLRLKYQKYGCLLFAVHLFTNVAYFVFVFCILFVVERPKFVYQYYSSMFFGLIFFNSKRVPELLSP